MSSDGTKGPVAIHGVKADDPSKPPTRLELRDMRLNHPEMYNLFLLGLERFMSKDFVEESAPLSYFQVAGIHGRPYTRWPDQPWNNEDAVDEDDGYCTHSSILFLPWHRPYLALYETVLYKHVNSIAQEYGADENGDRYIEAAKNFRLPYWDWALRQTNEVTLFPKECWSTVRPSVIRPKSKGVPTEMSVNPLASYEFGDVGKADSRINRFPKVNKTLRQPNAGLTSTDERVTQQLGELYKANNKGKNLTERTLFILQSYTEYAPMSNNLWEDQRWEGWGSLEDIHNSVHAYVGGRGQMGDPSVAGFDPIFWLHHCNIDRLFAIWQALHPEKTDVTYVTPQEQSVGTRFLDPGTAQDKNSPLAPFTRSEMAGDYWNSDQVRDTKTFGYVYPETQDWIFTDIKAIKKELNRVYRDASLGNVVAMSEKDIAKTHATFKQRASLIKQVAATDINTPMLLQVSGTGMELPQHMQQPMSNIELPSDRNLGHLIIDGKYLEWLVNIKVQKYARNGDFKVDFFLGDPADDHPGLYVLQPNHVATFATFATAASSGCKKCEANRADKVEVTGQVPLTIALVERFMAGVIDNLGVEEVTAYLQKNLHWRVTNGADEILSRREIDGLLIGVVTNEVTVPSDADDMPRYAPTVTPIPEITRGRGEDTGFAGGDIPFSTAA